ncbi:hypothetical protein AB0D34_39880 [Streptomyces sp. NPDC048420]|uniref:hypothetical protein n=1 Tax=Streptomyces sp. NPDC048420 TaxID=3155755 RepID=UPI00342569E4
MADRQAGAVLERVAVDRHGQDAGQIRGPAQILDWRSCLARWSAEWADAAACEDQLSEADEEALRPRRLGFTPCVPRAPRSGVRRAALTAEFGVRLPRFALRTPGPGETCAVIRTGPRRTSPSRSRTLGSPP